jgi:hypothetical protein
LSHLGAPFHINLFVGATCVVPKILLTKFAFLPGGLIYTLGAKLLIVRLKDFDKLPRKRALFYCHLDFELSQSNTITILQTMGGMGR